MAIERNESVELLRVVMMLFIIMLHVSGKLLPNVTESVEYGIWHVFRSFFFLGVSTFALISGYYGVKWNPKKFFEFEVMAVTYGAVVSVMVLALKLGGMKVLFWNLLPISTGSCWYFSAYMMLMLFMKFTSNSKIDNFFVDKKIVMLLFFVTYVVGFFMRVNGTTFLMLVVLYMFGRYFRYNTPGWLKRNAMLVFIVSTLVNAALFYVASYKNIMNGVLLDMLSNNHNPLLLISAISLFLIVEQKEIKTKNSAITKVASCMFAVYVFHVLLIDQVLDSYISTSSFNRYVVFLLYVTVLFIIPLLFEVARKRMISPIINRIFNCFAR